MIDNRHTTNENEFKKYKFIAFDTEAFKHSQNGIEYQTLAIGFFYDGNRYYKFTTQQQFLDLIEMFILENNKVMFVAHNLKYDLQILGMTDLLIKNEEFYNYKKDFAIIGDVNYFRYKLGKKEFIFNDTWNFFKTKLKKIAKELGLTKYADEKEYNYSGEVWNKYIKENGEILCKKDTEILYKLLEYMRDSEDVKFYLSSANTSFKTWLSMSDRNLVIDLDRFNLIVNEMYRGGRVELYHRFINEYSYSIDINSLYPFVMKYFKFSIKFRREIKDIDNNYIIENIRNQSFNYVMLVSYKSTLKRTPIMTKTLNGMLCDFQEVNYKWVSGYEFEELYSSDKDLKFTIHKCYEFINKDLFSKFVDYFYNKKMNSTGILREFNKLILNSSYGKLGQREKYTYYESYDNIPELKAFKSNERITYNNVVYSLFENFYSYSINGTYKYASLIASEITSLSRVINFRYQRLIGFDNVISTDTDSFRIKKDILENVKEIGILNDKELGLCKIEWDKSGYHFGYGLKDYEVKLDNNELIKKKKGIPEDSIRILKLNELDLSDKKVNEIIKEYHINTDEDLENIYLYKTKQFKTINRTTNSVIVKTIYKILTYDTTKLKYDNNISKIFKNENEFLKYNKINIRVYDNCLSSVITNGIKIIR